MLLDVFLSIIAHLYYLLAQFLLYLLVESREVIKPRPSLLDLGVRLSPHPAPDILSFRFCSCVEIGDMIDVLLQDSSYSNSGDFRLHDVDVLSVPL